VRYDGGLQQRYQAFCYQSAEVDWDIHGYRAGYSCFVTFYLIIALGVFIAMNLYRRRKIVKKYGCDSRGIKIIFGWISSSSPSGKEEYSTLKDYCMSCDNEHKRVACPDCGSKMKGLVKCLH
jgi:hypothetical protein